MNWWHSMIPIQTLLLKCHYVASSILNIKSIFLQGKNIYFIIYSLVRGTLSYSVNLGNNTMNLKKNFLIQHLVHSLEHATSRDSSEVCQEIWLWSRILIMYQFQLKIITSKRNSVLNQLGIIFKFLPQPEHIIILKQ